MIIIQIKKKNGRIDNFDSNKIRNAIISAWIQVGMPNFNKIDEIVSTVQEEIKDKGYENDCTSVEEVENIVMSVLFKEVPDVAREYSSYKMDRERAKKNPTEIEKVLYVNDEVGSENANKNAELTHIKNAYLAEIPSKEMMRKLLPKDCVKAHDKSIVYFHDAAYSVRSMENCRLLNLDELLQNGCEINGVWIDKPKSFRTAVTIATQALTHITSNSYGGCTINLLHLAKFVDVSRQKIKNKYDNYNIDDETKSKLVSDDLNEEIKQGMQTFTYQNQTLCSSVGQAVFLTVSVYLNEEPKYTNDLILIFTEMLRQRIQGIKDKSGAYVNPNFPKILYFLDKDTMRGGKYYDVTKLCAECSAKRLVPDYMSVKKHMELKGICTASMGKWYNVAHVKSFELCQKVYAKVC